MEEIIISVDPRDQQRRFLAEARARVADLPRLETEEREAQAKYDALLLVANAAFTASGQAADRLNRAGGELEKIKELADHARRDRDKLAAGGGL